MHGDLQLEHLPSRKNIQQKTWKKFSSVIIVSSDTKTNPTRSARHPSKSTPVLHVRTSYRQTSVSGFTTSYSSFMPSFTSSFCNVCYDPGHSTPKFLLLAQESFSQPAIIFVKHMHKNNGQWTLKNSQRGGYNRSGRFEGRGRVTSLSWYRDANVSRTQKNPAPNQKN